MLLLIEQSTVDKHSSPISDTPPLHRQPTYISTTSTLYLSDILPTPRPLAPPHLMLLPMSTRYSLLHIMHFASFPYIQSTYLIPFNHVHGSPIWIIYVYMHIQSRLLGIHPFACCCELSTCIMVCFQSMMSAFFKYNQPRLLSSNWCSPRSDIRLV